MTPDRKEVTRDGAADVGPGPDRSSRGGGGDRRGPLLFPGRAVEVSAGRGPAAPSGRAALFEGGRRTVRTSSRNMTAMAAAVGAPLLAVDQAAKLLVRRTLPLCGPPFVGCRGIPVLGRLRLMQLGN